jgi:hypothetical protein
MKCATVDDMINPVRTVLLDGENISSDKSVFMYQHPPKDYG